MQTQQDTAELLSHNSGNGILQLTPRSHRYKLGRSVRPSVMELGGVSLMDQGSAERQLNMTWALMNPEGKSGEPRSVQSWIRFGKVADICTVDKKQVE